MAETILSLRNLTKSYGSLVVTDNLSLDVDRAEIHAIIGPNGAGKTSLIHQISGAIPSDTGTIMLDGVDVTTWPMARRVRAGLARTFQITSVFPGFPIIENVALAVQAREGTSLRFFGNAAQEEPLNQAAHEMLALVGLADRASVPARELSHGEKRQLELAMALATKPRVLLLDEPLAGMGHAESRALIALLHRIRRDCTIILVEHDMDAVFSLADRVSVLVYGQIIATGSPEAIRSNADVRAAYLGEET